MMSLEVESPSASSTAPAWAVRSAKALIRCTIGLVVFTLAVLGIWQYYERGFVRGEHRDILWREALSELRMNFVTWNAGLTSGKLQVDHLMKNDSGIVTVVCLQEAKKSIDMPPGWTRVFKRKMVGSTKPGEVSNLVLAVYYLEEAPVSLVVLRTENIRVSFNGKGAVWAVFELVTQKLRYEFAVMCVHIPVEPVDREPAITAVVSAVHRMYKPKQCGEESFFKGCWGSLNHVFLIGDFNYRLKPESPEKARQWLREELANQNWSGLRALDTMDDNSLLIKNGFLCNVPMYEPTYKIYHSDECVAGDYSRCYVPDDDNDKWRVRGGELPTGWPDRICWLDAQEQSSSLQLAYDRADRQLIGDSDHLPLTFAFDVNMSQLRNQHRFTVWPRLRWRKPRQPRKDRTIT